MKLILFFILISFSLTAQTTDNLQVIRKSFYDPHTVYVRKVLEHNPKRQKKERGPDKKTDVSLDRSAYFLRIKSRIFESPEGFDIIEVFKSERYFEDTFMKRYKKIPYVKDTDGYYFLAKLTYKSDEENLAGMDIYPGLITNVCYPGMHGNKKSCTAEKTDELNFKAHSDALVSYALLIEKAKISHNQDSLQYWYKTEIKRFDLEIENNEVTGLKKQYTKYGLSDDLLLNDFYRFDRLEVNTDTTFGLAVFNKLIENTAEDSRQSVAVVDSATLKQTAETATEAPTAVNTVKAWLYAGKLKQKVVTLDSTVFLPNKSYVFQSEGNQWLTKAALNYRQEAPRKVNNVWQKGKVAGIIPGKWKFKILENAQIPGIDGYPLLWLLVEFVKP